MSRLGELSQSERAALDRYITGNYGEDQFKDLACENCGETIGEDDPCPYCNWDHENGKFYGEED